MEFRRIRKRNNAISDEAARALLHSCRRGVLAVNGLEGYPYAVPVNYYYDEPAGKIYFHGARVGHKAEAMQACDKVCFTVYGNETVQEEEAWAPYMQSTVVYGRCHRIEDREETLKLVKTFAMKYYPDEKTADDEIAVSGRAVTMYEITIEHLSGKQIQEK